MKLNGLLCIMVTFVAVQADLWNTIVDETENVLQDPLDAFSTGVGYYAGRGTIGLVDQAKDAATEVINLLFDQKLAPLLQDLKVTVNQDIDKVNDDVLHALKFAADTFQTAIDTAIKEAQASVKATIEEIKSEIIDDTLTKLSFLESSFFGQLNNILDRVDAIIDKVDCTASATTEGLRKIIGEIVDDPFPNGLTDQCRISLDKTFPGIRWKFASAMPDWWLFNLEKCRYTHLLTPESPVAAIYNSYKVVEELAAYMRCKAVSMKNEPDAETFVREMAKAQRVCNTFAPKNNNLMNTKTKSAATRSHYQELLRVANVGTRNINKDDGAINNLEFRLTAAVRGDVDCATPIECYSQALENLQEEKNDLARFKALAQQSQVDAQNAVQIATQAMAQATTAQTSATTALSQSGTAVSTSNDALTEAKNTNTRVSSGPTKCREGSSGYPSGAGGGHDLCELDRNNIACNSGEVLVNLRAVTNNGCNGSLGYVWLCCSW